MRFLIGSLFGSKRELLMSLLERGMVMVHLDARRDGVQVPSAYGRDAHLRLNLSLNFGLDDFEVGDDAVSAGLSFKGQRFNCVMPWPAVFAITSHVEPVGYLWPDDLPSELASQLGAGSPRGSSERPSLRVVAAQPEAEMAEVAFGRESTLAAEASDVEQPGPDRRHVHLRVVK